jgi:hypothetical protein
LPASEATAKRSTEREVHRPPVAGLQPQFSVRHQPGRRERLRCAALAGEKEHGVLAGSAPAVAHGQ